MNPNSHPRFINTLFSSLSQFHNSSNLFPTHDRRIGLTITCGYHPEHKCVMVLIEEEQPSFISTSVGEYIEPEKVESLTRKKCSELAEMCRRQAQELIEHANRLEALTNQKQPLIDPSKLDKDSDHDTILSSRYEEPVRRQNHTPSRAPHQTRDNESTIATTSRRSLSLDMDDI